MAQVELTPDAVEQADALPKPIKKRLRNVLKRLANWPAVSGAKPLRGRLAGWFRLRSGDYRIRFRVEGDTVIVDKIGHRKDVYEE